jgi:hypothetical protein
MTSMRRTSRPCSDTCVTMPNLPPWALNTGLPSVHVAHAALHVAAIVDARGSRSVDAEESYWHHATGGAFAPPDLQRGERLLLDAGLLVERDSSLIPTANLEEMLRGSVEDALVILSERALELSWPARHDAPDPAVLDELVSDPARREELLLALGRRFDDARRRVVGDIGEEVVAHAARMELRALDRLELARDVRRVSLLSDQIGYDVSAPRIGGTPRLLEVKATAAGRLKASVLVHLSRNEADVGASFPTWALVVCVVDDVNHRRGHVLGWCAAAALDGLLPRDGSYGRWEQAAVEVPIKSLLPGLPSLVA